MGQQQSKDELLYQQVSYGNVEGIKALSREGANLEWIDKEGKTPLIVACRNPQLFNVAKTLIELGANVNAYCPGSHGGTPLHHAAKRGLDPTVRLLLSHGANALTMNDDCFTPLDVARQKNHTIVVRTIEHHIGLFYGWMRELYGPGFLEALAPQWLSKKIWVVVLPCSSRNPSQPLRLELAIYNSPQDARPRVVIALSKAKIEEPKFQQADPTMIIYGPVTKTRFKLAAENEGDKHQLQQFDNACRGIPQVMQPPLSPHVPAASSLNTTEVAQLPMAINASIHSATERPPLHPNTDTSSGAISTNDWDDSAENSSHSGWGPVAVGCTPPSKASSSGWLDKPAKDPFNGWDVPETSFSSHATQQNIPPAVPITQENPVAPAMPSAPPIPEDLVDGPVHYPSIDSTPAEFPTETTEDGPAKTNEKKEYGVASSSCVICLDAPVEGACIPCGHMAGCMSCLNDIKSKKWGCPICRAKIDQVIRLYAV